MDDSLDSKEDQLGFTPGGYGEENSSHLSNSQSQVQTGTFNVKDLDNRIPKLDLKESKKEKKSQKAGIPIKRPS